MWSSLSLNGDVHPEYASFFGLDANGAPSISGPAHVEPDRTVHGGSAFANLISSRGTGGLSIANAQGRPPAAKARSTFSSPVPSAHTCTAPELWSIPEVDDSNVSTSPMRPHLETFRLQSLSSSRVPRS